MKDKIDIQGKIDKLRDGLNKEDMERCHTIGNCVEMRMCDHENEQPIILTLPEIAELLRLYLLSPIEKT